MKVPPLFALLLGCSPVVSVGSGAGAGGAPEAPPRCRPFEADPTCHTDKPIAIECDDNQAPAPACELHNLEPEYFCCPLANEP